MKKSVSAFINKVTGEGVVMIGTASFKTTKRRAIPGSVVFIFNPTFSFGEYNEGDILKVSSIDKDALDGSIYAKTSVEESLIFFEEYLVLVPQNLEAGYLAATITSGKVTMEGVQKTDLDEDGECEHFDQFAKFADEIPDICLGCGNREGCYVDIDFDEDDEDGEPYWDDNDGDEDGDEAFNELYRLALAELDEAVASEAPTMGDGEAFLTEIGVLPMTQKFLRVKVLNTLEASKETIKFHGEDAIAEFVELEDAVILALIKRKDDGKVLSSGLSQCNPDDEFFYEIGKVIALYRAGGKEVPRELIHFASYKVA